MNLRKGRKKRNKFIKRKLNKEKNVKKETIDLRVIIKKNKKKKHLIILKMMILNHKSKNRNN